MSRIKHYWLASYPKSGNTWLRLFLSNMIHAPNDDGPDINNIKVGDIASSRHWVENSLGIEIKELSDDEIDALRPFAYRWSFEQKQYAQHTTHQFHKIHDAFRILPNGQCLIPEYASRGTVYIVRNPLDIVVSGANHANISFDQAVSSLCDQQFTISRSRTSASIQLRQFIGDWSPHVSSWLHSDMNTLVIRYEDMNQQPLPTFQRIARFLDLPDDANTVKAALLNCQFDKVQQRENENGFNEKSYKVANFFRKGIVGDWVNHLNDEQINAITTHHSDIMQHMGYLDHADKPLTKPRAVRF